MGPVALTVLRPALRYSYTREAYVLRLVGNHRGPVFVRRSSVPAAVAAASAAEPVTAASAVPPVEAAPVEDLPQAD